MRDDDYNRLMSREASSKHFAIIFLITILMACLLVWSVASAEEKLPYVDEHCAFSFACQGEESVWELLYGDQVIPLGDMTKEQCDEALAELDPQTPPFLLHCRERLVERQDL